MKRAVLITVTAAVSITTVFGQTTKIREGTQTTGALPTAQGGAPSGGTTGQALKKNSNSDYDYSWGTILLENIQNAVGNSKLLGSGTSGSGNPYTELTLPAAGGIIASSTNVLVDQGSNFNPTFAGQFQFAVGRTIASGASAGLNDVRVKAATTTVTGGTNITTATGFNKAVIERPTYTDATPVTVSLGATLYIQNSPLAAGSLSLTNPYALWVDDGVVRLDGGLGVGVTTDPGTGNIDISGVYKISGADKSTDWNTAFTDRLKWDGGATGLTAATGRTSLGGTTVGQALFTLTDPSAISFLRVNANNSVTTQTAANFRTDLSLVVGTNVQAWDTDLDTWATKTPYAGTVTVTTGKTLNASNTLSFAGTDSTTITFQGTDTYVGRATTDTLTNKRVTKRTATSATNNTTPTPNSDTTDLYIATGMTVNMVFGAPTGTPTEGQMLMIRIKDNNTARTLDFNAAYRFSTDLAKPTTTVIGKTMYLGFIWNATDSVWDNLAQLNNL